MKFLRNVKKIISHSSSNFQIKPTRYLSLIPRTSTSFFFLGASNFFVWLCEVKTNYESNKSFVLTCKKVSFLATQHERKGKCLLNGQTGINRNKNRILFPPSQSPFGVWEMVKLTLFDYCVRHAERFLRSFWTIWSLFLLL